MYFKFFERKRAQRAIEGLLMSIGSPLGWFVIQLFASVNPIADLIASPGVYIYMSIGTALAFVSFGYYVGIYEEKIEALALIDPLTSLYNHRYFHERLHQEYASAMRNDTQIAVVLFDLDHFKSINDQHGHLAGDQILRDVSKNMKLCSRESETIARVGGEEFCVILPGCDQQQALVAAERFCHAIRQVAGEFEDGSKVVVTVSAGVASTSTCSSSTGKPTGMPANEKDLYAQADEAMYLAKKRGRNRVAHLP